jgi:hypothetical protein
MSGTPRAATPRSTRNESESKAGARNEGIPGSPQHRRETAQYLADMILELRNVAKSARLHTVMVPLEYAYYEAFGVANRVEVPDEEIERIRELSRAVEDIESPPDG